MRFAVGDSGTFLDAVKGGLFGAALDNGLGGGALGAAGLYNPTKGVLGTDSGPANFIKRGGVAGLAGYNPMEGIVGDSSPFGNFGGGLGAIGGLFGKGGKSRGVSGLGGFRPAGLIGSLFGA